MNLQEHLLTCAAEESSEITKEACKMLRFGCDDRDPSNPEGPTNTERFITEVNQLIAICEMLVDDGTIPAGSFDDAKAQDIVNKKKAKIAEFLKYSKQKGTLQ